VQPSRFDPDRRPHTMTNMGLRLELLITEPDSEGRIIAPLNCRKVVSTIPERSTHTAGKVICLSVYKDFHRQGSNIGQAQFCYRSGYLASNYSIANNKRFRRETLFFQQDSISELIRYIRPNVLLVKASMLSNLGFRLRDKWAECVGSWDIEDADKLYLNDIPICGGAIAAVEYSRSSGKLFILVGCSYGAREMWIDARSGSEDLILAEVVESLDTVTAEGQLVDRSSQELIDGTILYFALKRGVYRNKEGQAVPAYVLGITKPERKFTGPVLQDAKDTSKNLESG